MACQESLVGLFDYLLSCPQDTSFDVCHLEVISIGSGCNVARNNHLFTWGLDTALIDDLHRRKVERWSPGGVFFLRCARQARRDGLEACFRGNLDLVRLTCPTREVFP